MGNLGREENNGKSGKKLGRQVGQRSRMNSADFFGNFFLEKNHNYSFIFGFFHICHFIFFILKNYKNCQKLFFFLPY